MKLDLDLLDSETARGQRWEGYVQAVIEATGRKVERQTTKAAFDLLVDGQTRVNVKSAVFSVYGACKGFFFGLGSTWTTCDVFSLVKVDGSLTPQILWVPSSEAKQQTITLTKKNRFNEFTRIEVLDLA